MPGANLRPSSSPTGDVEDLLVLAAGGILILVAAWYLVSIVAFMHAKKSTDRNIRAAVARWGPPIIKTLAATGLATSLAAPAMASTDPTDLSWGADLPDSATQEALPSLGMNEGTGESAADDLWLPEHAQTRHTELAHAQHPVPATNTRVPDTHATNTHAPVTHATNTDRTIGDQLLGSLHLVQPGDTLWSIVRAHYSPATDSEVADLVLDLWQANSTTIGINPDLIYPGQRLELP